MSKKEFDSVYLNVSATASAVKPRGVVFCGDKRCFLEICTKSGVDGAQIAGKTGEVDRAIQQIKCSGVWLGIALLDSSANYVESHENGSLRF